jgi:hypothetical protein
VPICTRCTLVDLTPKYPTLVATTPGAGCNVYKIYYNGNYGTSNV